MGYVNPADRPEGGRSTKLGRGSRSVPPWDFFNYLWTGLLSETVALSVDFLAPDRGRWELLKLIKERCASGLDKLFYSEYTEDEVATDLVTLLLRALAGDLEPGHIMSPEELSATCQAVLEGAARAFREHIERYPGGDMMGAALLGNIVWVDSREFGSEAVEILEEALVRCEARHGMVERPVIAPFNSQWTKPW